MPKFVDLKELFPSKWNAGLFFLYVALFVNQGLLVTSSQEANSTYNYNTVLAVLFTEVLKLMICIFLYSMNNPIVTILEETKKNMNVLWLYFVPASLYCIYNNLSYTNLAIFDPTTYFILLQLRVVITGIVFQCIFKENLSAKQWISLVILTFGCMMKQVHFADEKPINEALYLKKHLQISASPTDLLIVIQILCSCFAGVYNEHLLKNNMGEVNVYIQNIFMYVDSIICNLAVIIWLGDLSATFSYSTLSSFINYKVFLVVVNNAAIGIVTSFFLKNLNSILKTFASSLELVFTAVISRLLFSIPIHLNTTLAILFIIFATVLYSQNPVNNTKNLNKPGKLPV